MLTDEEWSFNLHNTRELFSCANDLYAVVDLVVWCTIECSIYYLYIR